MMGGIDMMAQAKITENNKKKVFCPKRKKERKQR